MFTLISGLQQLASGAVTADAHLAATVAAGITAFNVVLAILAITSAWSSRRSPSIDSGTARLSPMIKLHQGWQLRISRGQPFRAGPPPFVTESLRGTFPAEPSCKRKGDIELMPTQSLPHVIIVGGGFAGLNAARALAAAPVEVTLVDRRNHHVFQPFLYQVATASLSPADISAPIRTVLRGQDNCEVVLAEVTGVDVEERRVRLGGGHVQYDYLILATGATHAYFGHDDWAPIAPGLKSLEDAVEMRRRILLAFESAEQEGNAASRQAALTFAIVGGGPTGVELAGAIKEIAGQTIAKEYKHIDTRTTRVILFEGGDRLLPTFAPSLSARAQRDLERLGVEVRLKAIVTNVTRDGAYIGNAFIPVRNVFWAAGVKASPLGKALGVPLDRAGRVIVGPDLTIPAHPEVFVAGDLAAAKSAVTGKPVPGVAQGGMQMGRYAGDIIAREVREGRSVRERRAFEYRDKGSMAVIGKSRAVADLFGRWKVGGFVAWLMWGAIHILFLIGFRNRLQVMLAWFWNWLLNARDVRLINGDARLDILVARSEDFIPEEKVLTRAAPDGGGKP